MILISKHLCMVSDIGVNDNLFGGRMLCWLDESGAMFVSETLKTKRVVTKTIEKVEFLVPVKSHDTVHIKGEVQKVGVTSLTIVLEAWRVHPELDEHVMVCRTSMVFVKVDEHGKSQPHGYVLPEAQQAA